MLQLVQYNEQNAAEIAVNAAQELTLSEKIMVANHPAVKQALATQLQEEEERANTMSVDSETFINAVNKAAQEEAKKYGRKLLFKVFLHPAGADRREFKLREGLIVHIHYYGDAPYVWTKPFWVRFRGLFPMVERLTRSSSLIVRDVYWKERLNKVPRWKKVKIQDEEREFELLLDDEHQDEREVRIVKRHRSTGLMVSVSGPLKMEQSLEREALVILSQKVAEYRIMQEMREQKPATLGVGNMAEYFGRD